MVEIIIQTNCGRQLNLSALLNAYIHYLVNSESASVVLSSFSRLTTQVGRVRAQVKSLSSNLAGRTLTVKRGGKKKGRQKVLVG